MGAVRSVCGNGGGGAPSTPIAAFGMDAGMDGDSARSPLRREDSSGDPRGIPKAASVGAPPPPTTPIPRGKRHSSLQARNKRALPAIPPGHSDAQDVDAVHPVVLPARPNRLLPDLAATSKRVVYSSDSDSRGCGGRPSPLPGAPDAEKPGSAGTELNFV